MKKLLVYADFDWLTDIELIGELSYESLCGSDSYGFSFNRIAFNICCIGNSDDHFRNHGFLLPSVWHK